MHDTEKLNELLDKLEHLSFLIGIASGNSLVTIEQRTDLLELRNLKRKHISLFVENMIGEKVNKELAKALEMINNRKTIYVPDTGNVIL